MAERINSLIEKPLDLSFLDSLVDTTTPLEEAIESIKNTHPSFNISDNSSDFEMIIFDIPHRTKILYGLVDKLNDLENLNELIEQLRFMMYTINLYLSKCAIDQASSESSKTTNSNVITNIARQHEAVLRSSIVKIENVFNHVINSYLSRNIAATNFANTPNYIKSGLESSCGLLKRIAEHKGRIESESVTSLLIFYQHLAEEDKETGLKELVKLFPYIEEISKIEILKNYFGEVPADFVKYFEGMTNLWEKSTVDTSREIERIVFPANCRMIKKLLVDEDVGYEGFKILHKKFGISHFARYPISMLKNQLLYLAKEPEKKPENLVFCLFAQDDYNASLYSEFDMLKALPAQLPQTPILITEATNWTDILRRFALIKSHDHIGCLFVSAHGGKSTLSFGDEDKENHALGLQKARRGILTAITESKTGLTPPRYLQRLFTQKPIVILSACNAGKSLAKNIRKLLGEKKPKMYAISGETGGVEHLDIVTSEEGFTIRKIKFWGIPDNQVKIT